MARLNRPHDASHLGHLSFSVGAAWADKTGADFSQVSALKAPAAGDVFARLRVQNDSVNTLYLLLKPNAAAAVGTAIEIRTTETVDLDLYGAAVTTISLQGSAPATAGRITAWFEAA